MPGSLLQDMGDVQIGADNDNPVLLRYGYISASTSLVAGRVNASAEARRGRPTGQWMLTDFNPSSAMDVVSSDAPQVHRPGMKPGADVATSRKFEFRIMVHETSRTNLQDKIKALAYHFSPRSGDPYDYPSTLPRTEQEISWTSFKSASTTTSWVMYGRFRGAAIENLSHTGLNRAIFKVRFEALDPLIYSTSSTSVTINKTTDTYTAHPLTYWNGQPLWPGGTYTTVNIAGATPELGSGPSRWWIEITGPTTNPAVFMRKWASVYNYATPRISLVGVGNGEHVSNGRVDVNLGSKLTFDYGQRTVMLMPLSAYYDRQLTVGHGWLEAWPKVDLIFAPNGSNPAGANPPLTSTSSSAVFFWRRGYWFVV